MAEWATSYGRNGWKVLALRGKIPAIAGGRGVLDATDDHESIAAVWASYPWANIGAQVPPRLVAIDTDPRHDGERRLCELADEHGGLPATLTVHSGRGDGGRHRYYRRPAGEITAARLPEGVDLKTSAGYCVMPPSIHPDSGQPYRFDEPMLAPAPTPWWLASLLRPEPRPVRARPVQTYDGDSIADWFSATRSWADVLQPEQWAPVDAEGLHWRHPTATSAVSATVRHDLLFVYSTNTPFEPTEPGRPVGYTRFRAWALLVHSGDLSAAARAARALRGAS
jgi:hypothetical protein